MSEYAPALPSCATNATVPLPPMSAAAVADVRGFEAAILQMPQVDIATEHAFHAGMYARTIMIPAGVVLTGAEIKIPTILIISGDVLAYGDGDPERISGYHVALGQAGRKQAFIALADTWLTMLFPTAATDADAAEREFTDEHEILFSRKGA